ncbi:hypothetical protein TUM20985_33310 [Mycobacterium antarcticum]|uniref:ANTAR domain-containing protein n=1 Tax=unclassified Mycolicibacterium TaxID=2636767 RepID=UPI002392DEDA|nr:MULTISPECIES: ANTAR domain-containing protein [unclassified Mycolicibacterium]BDX32784.1 hypothetical protein TUM20985_33310 [Mycolicibacterium sp. TUM20985]GLP78103.1 hypothetical protein TUM20983_52130 [Mycolicibacterium sp. TUM20983]
MAAPDSVAASPDRAIALRLTGLTSSVEPAVVFASLAELSVGSFSDTCTVDVVEEHKDAYRISYPLVESDVSAQTPHFSTRTVIRLTEVGAQPHYAGIVVHAWHTHHPTSADATIAALLVERAVAVIATERSWGAALRSNREIGIAMGILMARHQIGAQAAFAMLREVSQVTNSKLRDVAERFIAMAPGSPTAAGWAAKNTPILAAPDRLRC